MHSLVLGSYVLYKGTVHIALSYDGNLVKLINPLKGNQKLNVSTKHLAKLGYTCNKVTYQGNDYLVTNKDIIISLKTNKICKWGIEHKERRDILRYAHASRLLVA